MTDPFIACDNLVKIYKVADPSGLRRSGQSLEVVALQGLDLAVAPGEMLGIVGASGSGKSTLLNILGGLDQPSAGRVTVDGRDLLKLSAGALDRYRRTEVGFVWQQVARNLIPYLTARQNVELPMTVAGAGLLARRRRSRELLDAVGLWEHRRHRLVQLSGGQQQRVAIAVALANNPKLLLADEPTGEVDSVTAQSLYDLFRDLNRAYGLTTIIVTHDPQIARQVDRVVAIRDGRTSSETIRRVSPLEQHPGRHAEGTRPSLGTRSGEPQADEGEPEAVSYHDYVVVDAAGRLQVPAEMLAQRGIGDRATLELTEDGILIRPADGREAAERAAGGPAADAGDAPPAAPRRRWWQRHDGGSRARSR